MPSTSFVCDGMKTGPRGASKSVVLGGGNLYLIGVRALPLFFCFGALDFGSGVPLELVSGAFKPPPFDSRFFNDSFFALDVRSRARGLSSLEALKSGFNGDDTVGRWSSSRTRFWGMEETETAAIASDLAGDSWVDMAREPCIPETPAWRGERREGRCAQEL